MDKISFRFSAYKIDAKILFLNSTLSLVLFVTLRVPKSVIVPGGT